MPYLPIIGAISLVLLIAAALILIISIRARKKVKEIEEELRKQEQEQIQVPSESEQKEMFARNRDDGQSSFSYRRSPTTEISADPDIAALLGRKPSDMAQSRKNRPNDDLLSLMFEEENDGGEDATTDSENDETERSRPQIPQIPISEEIPGPSSISGSDRNDINEEEQPTDDQPSLGDAEELVQDLQMRVKCSECQAQFRVKIPDGAPGVRASCPTCGSLQVVRRP
jgi:DNA-directed RNA polymerase subunit RPC12/RpoP